MFGDTSTLSAVVPDRPFYNSKSNMESTGRISVTGRLVLISTSLLRKLIAIFATSLTSPSTPASGMTVRLIIHSRFINISFHPRWLAVDQSPTSGAVTVEVEMPSGYGFVQSDANMQASKFAFLRDVLVASNKVVWLFDKVRSHFIHSIHLYNF